MTSTPDRNSLTAECGSATDPAVPALALRSITKSFGDFIALDDVDFDLRQGEVHSLLGENGAGKSSLMNVAAGLYAADRGTIEVAGRPAAIRGPSDAQALHIGMVHQHYKLVMPFTAVENILLANPSGGFEQSLQHTRQLISEKADLVGFDVDLDKPVGALSIAEQQRVEILKVLVAGANIIILDEPTAVLTDEEGQRLLEAIRKLASSGCCVALVTHKLHESLTHSDRITVMRNGKVVETVLPDRVTAPDLTTMIVGETLVENRHQTTVSGKQRLAVRGINAARADGLATLNDLSFDVRSGEIYGIAGVGGNGQSELVEVLMGLLSPSGGDIQLDGQGDITGTRADERRRFGVACIPADRQGFALAGDLSVSDNFSIGGVLSGKFGSWARLDRKSMARETRSAVEKYDVQGVRSDAQRSALLSGGNAQKLVIAREFSGSPTVVIAHSPNRGLDVRASAAVHGHLLSARDQGAAVVLISEDLDEILLLADRIGVMNSGTIVAEFGAPADRHAIGKAMVGHG
ncbi:MAG: ABC transporter ATP-binding protein [Hyphomicrobiales bacterium]|nr:ABC transporter ATP-binding protein [Hyphomicrobiales bacterium]MCP4999033.1 ABC transporter ATP-binding protein [Hyphomicrobiales bacterium]